MFPRTCIARLFCFRRSPAAGDRGHRYDATCSQLVWIFWKHKSLNHWRYHAWPRTTWHNAGSWTSASQIWVPHRIRQKGRKLQPPKVWPLHVNLTHFGRPPYQRLYQSFFGSDIWVKSESNLIHLSKNETKKARIRDISRFETKVRIWFGLVTTTGYDPK